MAKFRLDGYQPSGVWACFLWFEVD